MKHGSTHHMQHTQHTYCTQHTCHTPQTTHAHTTNSGYYMKHGFCNYAGRCRYNHPPVAADADDSSPPAEAPTGDRGGGGGGGYGGRPPMAPPALDKPELGGVYRGKVRCCHVCGVLSVSYSGCGWQRITKGCCLSAKRPCGLGVRCDCAPLTCAHSHPPPGVWHYGVWLLRGGGGLQAEGAGAGCSDFDKAATYKPAC